MIEQSCDLSQLESSVAVEVEHLAAMHTMFSETLEFDNKCYSRQLAAVASCKTNKLLSFCFHYLVMQDFVAIVEIICT